MKKNSLAMFGCLVVAFAIAFATSAAALAPVEETTDLASLVSCRALLPDIFYAGETTSIVVACQHTAAANDKLVAVLLSANVLFATNSPSPLQKFPPVRQARAINAGETASFQYDLQIDRGFDAGEYALAVGVHLQEEGRRKAFLSVAYNSTILIENKSVDAYTILTYFTLLAILCGAGYAVVSRVGSTSKQSKTSSTASLPSRGSDELDIDYVSKEHQLYRDQILSSSSPSPKRHSSSPRQERSSPKRRS